MPNIAEARGLINSADVLFSAEEVSAAVDRMAVEITEKLGEEYPLVLSVMGGAVVFTGQLLPRLEFPLDFDYVHVSRYGDKTHGGELVWKQAPKEDVRDRVVLVLDDILDEGHTMAAIRDKVMAMGAKAFYSGVFANKLISKEKPMQADFVGLDVPDRYVFGYGMDVRGAWRNLPAIYALK
ncbi:hypoxanthine-guanine phosphoribosyltransferase [Chromobacterium vaccinii]|uniref:Hypoxanthine-guanine phosphoribosyltransferase n=1 Tax=Chromobacterium vaccinii TaxID=1108595 RepID=A0A1D9LGL5_9NEIS|nr:hypoxanthine-guanine phosphoribosyltransferase [Chromobacterium vaccinii]AOZ50344.1 hypoxanthine-guanine phosphoribosyltransferase [Chromobacterium vaccinii]MCD4486894.1 hypoxanthine-guanine phosphoribosyltransferase [Chromobacterium vaccinii]MCD4499001.1 hypoxanthine-guanine phosphoribosyltransferase [Chromobacterium vaccinii]QND83367.1 Hypoxanthine-guanine phosphoribosyltransferase [Chromobacterium vaccinii]QND88598.1 Hypoxanthine-guanine phosphoribosyltransferase [Chromobacterium vaccini